MTNEEFQKLSLEHMARITQEITELNTKVTELNTEVTDVNKRLTNIELRLKNNLEPKIQGLYEWRETVNNKLDNIEEKVSQHDEYILKRIK